MKPFLTAILISFLTTLATAQAATTNQRIKSETVWPAMLAGLQTTVSPTAATSKELRKAERESKRFARATKAFATDFENASDALWYVGKGEYTVSFMQGGIRSIAWYSKGGALLYTLLSYDEARLPVQARKALLSEFSGYKINLVEEVRQANTTVYLVHLQDSCSIKLVAINDGIASLYRSYRKA
jgi:hypothetical protein